MTSSALTSMHARWRGCRNDGRRFYEPGFEELLDRALATGGCGDSTGVADAAGSSVHFLCVGTPQKRVSTPRTCTARSR
jgi:UDP-glucose 6-dehydrogenase